MRPRIAMCDPGALFSVEHAPAGSRSSDEGSSALIGVDFVDDEIDTDSSEALKPRNRAHGVRTNDSMAFAPAFH
jgi:hypothetical protein